MSNLVVPDTQFRVVGPDGTQIYGGGLCYNAVCEITSSEASATMQAGEAARFDSTNGIIPRFERVAAGAAIPTDIPQTAAGRVLRISAATDLNFLGIALGDIPPAKNGVAAGHGSILTGKCTATTIAVGAYVGGSATAGSLAAIAGTTSGTVLGLAIKTNTVAAPGTGSTTQVGVLVSQA